MNESNLTEFLAICRNIKTFLPGSYSEMIADEALKNFKPRELDPIAVRLLNSLSLHKGHRILELKAKLRAMTIFVNLSESDVNRSSYSAKPRRR